VTGQLGDRSVTVKTSPVLTGNGLAANLVVAGGSHTCAMTSTFDLYCWGCNGNGQLANGTRNNAFIPTRWYSSPESPNYTSPQRRAVVWYAPGRRQ
jgi:alpha-tubulin suppressor-like RCC1 family protein